MPLSRVVLDVNICVRGLITQGLASEAVDARADYLVTSDPHFDSLQGRYQNILILDPVAFLRTLRSLPHQPS